MPLSENTAAQVGNHPRLKLASGSLSRRCRMSSASTSSRYTTPSGEKLSSTTTAALLPLAAMAALACVWARVRVGGRERGSMEEGWWEGGSREDEGDEVGVGRMGTRPRGGLAESAAQEAGHLPSRAVCALPVHKSEAVRQPACEASVQVARPGHGPHMARTWDSGSVWRTYSRARVPSTSSTAGVGWGAEGQGAGARHEKKVTHRLPQQLSHPSSRTTVSKPRLHHTGRHPQGSRPGAHRSWRRPRRLRSPAAAPGVRPRRTPSRAGTAPPAPGGGGGSG